jgi:hypothetical protein
MNRDEALEQTIDSATLLMRTCGDYDDMPTAAIAAEFQRRLIARRSDLQVKRMERERGLTQTKRCLPR